MIPKIVLEHVKKTLTPDDPINRSKQEITYRRSEGKNQLMLIQFTDPHPNQLKYLWIYFPEETLDLDIDSLEQDINIYFEENSPHQEGVISEIYQRQDKLCFQEPPKLQSQVDISKLVQMFLTK